MRRQRVSGSVASGSPALGLVAAVSWSEVVEEEDEDGVRDTVLRQDVGRCLRWW